MILALIAIALLLALILVTITPPKEREGVLGLIYLGGFILLFLAQYQNGGLGDFAMLIVTLFAMVWGAVPTLHELWYGEPSIWTALAFIPVIFAMLVPVMVVAAILEARHNTAKKENGHD